MEYLEKFDTHSLYETYINEEDTLLPNVSYCKDKDEIHYNPSHICMCKVIGTNKFIPVYKGLPIGYNNIVLHFTSDALRDIIENEIPWGPAMLVSTSSNSSLFTYKDGTPISNVIHYNSVPLELLSRYVYKPSFIQI